MLEFLFRLFDTSDFPARWNCGQWSAAHGWMHIVSDLAIFSAYTAIPLVLVRLVIRRRDLPFLPIFVLFSAFILSCGLVHLVEASIFWQPWYRFSGLLKVITAVVSWGSVLGLASVMPRALALRGPESIAEQAAREAGERFQTLVSHTAQIVWTADADGAVREDSASWRAFTGQEVEEFLGGGWLDALHPDDREPVKEHWIRAVADRSTFANEFRLRHVSGEWRWVSAHAVPALSGDGSVRSWIGMNIDITDHKRAEDRFRKVVEDAPAAMLMVDAAGVIALVNAQTERLFGYAREELIGRSVEALVPERFRSEHPAQRESFFEDPRTRAMGAGRDLYGLRKDGTEVPVEIGLNPIRTEGGPHVLASIIDITERLQSAERLLQSLQEKDLLIKEVHHRVKNNLAVIGSLFYLQSTVTQDEPTLRILQDCRDRVQSMALVHERLYRSGDLASVDFAEYARELSNQLYRQYVMDSDAVRLRVDAEEVRLEIDRAIPCGLILTELVANSLKHAFPEGRTGEIVVSLRAKAGGGLVLSVSDDGVGLPESAPQENRGHSLGMRLVHSLTRQLDARMEFLRRDPGTEARLTLDPPHVHAD